jgi:quercetin dioxygenase-like cupin family protein
MHVQRWDAARDGVLTASRLRQRLEDQGLWVSERRYSPGEMRDEASADHDSVEVVLTGLLKLRVGDETAILSAGDAAFVPRGVARHVEIIGAGPVVCYAGAFLPNGPWPGRARLSHSFWR